MKVLIHGVRESGTYGLVLNALTAAGFDVVKCIGFRECLNALKNVWGFGNAVVSVAPTPLIIRLVSGLVKGKECDAAVVSVSPNSLKAEPILNTHYGALMMCEVIESLTGIKCVDPSILGGEGVMSPDDLAFRLRSSLIKGCVEDVSGIVKELVIGGRPRIYLDSRVLGITELLSDLRVKALLNRSLITNDPRNAELCITSRSSECSDCSGPCYVLRRVSVGLGLCSVVHPLTVIQSLMNTLNILKMPLSRVDVIAVPSSRSGHGFVKALKSLGVKVVEVGIDDALSYGVKSAGSRYGVRSVAEALARYALRGGESLIVKASYPHVTVSIVEGD